ncbi:MAG TPA: hypothetical protein VFZ11_09130 [Gemmatimonadaceae bacterium]
MHLAAARRHAALVALVALSASCSPDAATGPAAAEAPTVASPLLGGLIGGVVDELLACRVTESATTTQVVGPEGGTIVVGRHSLHIPSGALQEQVEITATAPAGDRVELQLFPHGLQFERRTLLRMSYAECGAVRGLLLRIAYVDDDGRTILEVLPSVVDLLRREVYGTTDHFSSYMLAY